MSFRKVSDYYSMFSMGYNNLFRELLGRVQDRLHPAAQALWHVLDDRRRPDNSGLACHPVKSGVGCRASEALGVQTDARCPGEHGQRRSGWEKGSIGVWEWSDHTLIDSHGLHLVSN